MIDLPAMKPEQGLDLTDADFETEADRRADADVATWRLVSHDAVKRWLTSWGSPTPLPPPRVGD